MPKDKQNTIRPWTFTLPRTHYTWTWKLILVAFASLVFLSIPSGPKESLDDLLSSAEGPTIQTNGLHSELSAGLKTHTNKDIIVYVYFETARSRKNFEFFLRHALHDQADFLFVVNGPTTVQIPTHLANVDVLRRDNSCFDLGTYHAVYSNRTGYNADQLKKYERFIFMNASIRGPFFPSWAQRHCWSDVYWRKLNDRTKVVGMSYFCDPFPPYQFGSHLQSQLLATDKIGADIIMKGLKCFGGHEDAVKEGEVRISASIMEAGYDAYAMMGSFSARGGLLNGSRGFQQHCNTTQKKYFEETTFSPYEMLFAKTNEKNYPEFPEAVVDQYSDWAAAINYSSFEACRFR